MNANLLLAEQIIRCVHNNVKNLTVFYNIHDEVKVKELVDAINVCLFKNDKDLFLTMIVSDCIEPGQIVTSTKDV